MAEKRGVYWADAPKNQALPPDADGHTWMCIGEAKWECTRCKRPALGAVYIVLGGEPGKLPTCDG